MTKTLAQLKKTRTMLKRLQPKYGKRCKQYTRGCPVCDFQRCIEEIEHMIFILS